MRELKATGLKSLSRKVLRTPPPAVAEAYHRGVSSWCEALSAIGRKSKSLGPKVDSDNGATFGATDLEVKA